MTHKPPPASLEELDDGRAFACEIPRRPYYTCMYCSKVWSVNDDGFLYWRPFSATHWMVKAGIVKAGDRMNVVDASQPKHDSGWPRTSRYSYAYDPLGHFARCVERTACDKRRRNNHNQVHPEHLSLLDELDVICADVSRAKEVMA